MRTEDAYCGLSTSGALTVVCRALVAHLAEGVWWRVD